MTGTVLFLPGASGNTQFWKPVGDRLTVPGERTYLGWPGFGPTPADPAVNGIQDLVAVVLGKMAGPSALIAQSANPSFPTWFATYRKDLTEQLKALRVPVLLLWGEVDPISPPPVGERLATLLPFPELHIIRGGDHDLAYTHADVVAPLIENHLRKPSTAA